MTTTLVERDQRLTTRGRIARSIFLAAVRRLPVTVDLGGETVGLGGPRITIHTPHAFFAALGRDGLIGFGESYMAGVWDSDELPEFIAVLATEVETLVPRSLQRLRAVALKRMPRRHRNTRDGARQNIAHHYDLSNAMFASFLDPTMTYSSALWEPGDTLEDAQGRKIERLLDRARVGPGTRVLEVGTGWGELAIRAARRGATVHSITLSAEQKALADERIAAAGLKNRATVALCDYRDVTGEYDAIVSVEMIEAVGWQYWRTYFETLDRVLAPGGTVAIQAITMPHHRMVATRTSHTWITKYIFPGGGLPSLEAIDQITHDHTRLRLGDRFSMGPHYATTLRAWDDNFTAHEDHVLALGFDDTFLRMWHFYLRYCEGGFASGYIDVNQLVLTREDA